MVRDFLILPEGSHAKRVPSQVVLTVTGGLLTEVTSCGAPRMAHAPLPPWISAPRLESQGRFVAAKRLEKTCRSPADICTQCSMSFQIRNPRSGLDQVSCSDQAKFLA